MVKSEGELHAGKPVTRWPWLGPAERFQVLYVQHANNSPPPPPPPIVIFEN